MDFNKELYTIKDFISLFIRFYDLYNNDIQLTESEREEQEKIADFLSEYVTIKDYGWIELLPFNQRNYLRALKLLTKHYCKNITKEKAKTFIKERKAKTLPIEKIENLKLSSRIEYCKFYLLDFTVKGLKSYNQSLYYEILIENAPKNDEMTLRFLKLFEKEIDEKVKEKLKELSFGWKDCHIYWACKKRILREEYDIEWFTPTEENPTLII